MFCSVSSVKLHSCSFAPGLSIGLQTRDKVSWFFIPERISYHLDVHGIKVPGSDVASKFTISVFALTKDHKTERNPMASGGLSITLRDAFMYENTISHAPKWLKFLG